MLHCPVLCCRPSLTFRAIPQRSVDEVMLENLLGKPQHVRPSNCNLRRRSGAKVQKPKAEQGTWRTWKVMETWNIIVSLCITCPAHLNNKECSFILQTICIPCSFLQSLHHTPPSLTISATLHDGEVRSPEH